MKLIGIDSMDKARDFVLTLVTAPMFTNEVLAKMIVDFTAGEGLSNYLVMAAWREHFLNHELHMYRALGPDWDKSGL